MLKICKKLGLYDAWIHITTKTLGDYTSPLTEFLAELTPDNHRLGNTMLVYVSACLGGLGYPTGTVPEEDVSRVKYDILRCLETVHSINGGGDEPKYPYVYALLKYNTRECLNVVELAFSEAEFSGEMGLLQRRRLVGILMEVVTPSEFSVSSFTEATTSHAATFSFQGSQIVTFACFVTKLVVSDSLEADDGMLDAVVRHLTQTPRDCLTLRDHGEREQAWLDLLAADKLSRFSTQDLLETALKSKCYRVAEHLYERLGDYTDILSCYLNDPVRRSEAFNYVLDYVSNEERRVEQQFLSNFLRLAATSGEKAAEIAVEFFPHLVETFSEMLDGDPELQFDFLGHVVNSDLKLPAAIAERYLEQLCVRDVAAVRGYVQLTLCRKERALEITRRYGAHEATALLLEHAGEWQEALELLLENGMVRRCAFVCFLQLFGFVFMFRLFILAEVPEKYYRNGC